MADISNRSYYIIKNSTFRNERCAKERIYHRKIRPEDHCLGKHRDARQWSSGRIFLSTPHTMIDPWIISLNDRRSLFTLSFDVIAWLCHVWPFMDIICTLKFHNHVAHVAYCSVYLCNVLLILKQELSQLAFYVNLHRAVIGPSATLTGRWRPDIDLRRMLTVLIIAPPIADHCTYGLTFSLFCQCFCVICVNLLR